MTSRRVSPAIAALVVLLAAGVLAAPPIPQPMDAIMMQGTMEAVAALGNAITRNEQGFLVNSVRAVCDYTRAAVEIMAQSRRVPPVKNMGALDNILRSFLGEPAPAEGDKKNDAPKKDESKKDESKKDESKKDETKKDESKPDASSDKPKNGGSMGLLLKRLLS